MCNLINESALKLAALADDTGRCGSTRGLDAHIAIHVHPDGEAGVGPDLHTHLGVRSCVERHAVALHGGGQSGAGGGGECEIGDVELGNDGGDVPVTRVEGRHRVAREHLAVVRGGEVDLVVLDPNVLVRVGGRDVVHQICTQSGRIISAPHGERFDLDVVDGVCGCVDGSQH